jgi:hypothetical protein
MAPADSTWEGCNASRSIACDGLGAVEARGAVEQKAEGAAGRAIEEDGDGKERQRSGLERPSSGSVIGCEHGEEPKAAAELRAEIVRGGRKAVSDPLMLEVN